MQRCLIDEYQYRLTCARVHTVAWKSFFQVFSAFGVAVVSRRVRCLCSFFAVPVVFSYFDVGTLAAVRVEQS